MIPEETRKLSDNELIAELFYKLGYHIDKSGNVIGQKNRRLNTKIGTSGYEQVNIYNNGKSKTLLVHRLVAIHYIPNPKNLPEVNHIDGDKTNNHYKNLEWCTRSDNIRHGIRTGLIKKSMVGRVGKKHWRSKTVQRFDMFGTIAGTFESTGEAAKETGFNAKSIQDACKGRLKTYKGFTWRYN